MTTAIAISSVDRDVRPGPFSQARKGRNLQGYASNPAVDLPWGRPVSCFDPPLQEALSQAGLCRVLFPVSQVRSGAIPLEIEESWRGPDGKVRVPAPAGAREYLIDALTN